MRALIQRVTQAKVEVNQEIISEIGSGLLVYLGVSCEDNHQDAGYIADKISNLRIFSDKKDKLNLSVEDIKGQVLIVSQFTLLGDCRKGRRPSFTQAASPESALELYEKVIELVRSRSIEVASGKFRADMKIFSVNDGPVTLLIDSKRLF